MIRKNLCFVLSALMVICMVSLASAEESLEKRVEALEKHIDKHITHAEGPAILEGINIAAGITMTVQTTSGNDDNSNEEDSTDGIISVDLEISKKIAENGEAFIALDAGNGSGLDNDELTTYWGVNGDGEYDDDSFTLSEAWYEHMFLDEMVTFTIGKLDMTNYFDGNDVANDETTQFLADGFVNSIAIEFYDNNPAMRLTVSPHEMVDISLGFQSDGWDDLDEKTFYIAEAHIKPQFSGLQGNYRIHIWANMSDHAEIADAETDQEHNSGYGISLDQQVTDFLTLFVRADYADKKVNANDFVWSGGLALSGSLWNRNDDVFGIAYGEALLSDDQKDTLSDPGDETHFEAYYSFAVNEYVAVSPDVQVVTNASGDDNFDTVWIGGIRGQITF